MQIIYEQLSGHRVGWKKALHYLTEHFSGGIRIGKQANQPIVLLIDELDLLLTRNQSVIISTKPVKSFYSFCIFFFGEWIRNSCYVFVWFHTFFAKPIKYLHSFLYLFVYLSDRCTVLVI
jgi:hypothetical protein